MKKNLNFTAPPLQPLQPLHRSTAFRRPIFILLLTLFFNLNSIIAQIVPTLCQQVGQNFVPDITIGILPSSLNYSSDQGADWTNKKVYIDGTFVINSNFQIHTCTLKMGKNAKIQIDPNVNFASYFSKYFRCASTWTGFVAMGGNSVFFFNHIEDAATAFDIKSASASIVVAANNINRNNVGLNASGIAVNALIAANIFDCTSSLNGTIISSFAGVQLSNCPSAAIGLTLNEPVYRNIFRNQRSGIRLSNSTASIGLSTFYNDGKGVLADYSNVTIQGVNADLTSVFLKNVNDIYATHSNLTVFLCYMDSCKQNNISSLMNNNREQVHIYDNTIRVTQEPSPLNPKYGISLDRSRFGSDGQFRNTIERNHLTIHDFSDLVRGGMAIRGAFSTRDFMRIDSNNIDVYTGGDKLNPTKFIDISINSADNFVVTRNKIRSTNTFSTGTSRWGIFLHDGATSPSQGNTLLYNDISGVGVHDDGCCAVHGQDAGPWKVCSNVTDLSYRGFHFMGNCGKSSFGLNTIKDHNIAPTNDFVTGAGLIIQGFGGVVNGIGGDNGFLGIQLCQENNWQVTNYPLQTAFTAILLGAGTNGPSFSTRDKNRFFVPDINDPHQAPLDRSPSGTDWFKKSDCLQSPTTCIEQAPPDFDEYEEWVRNNYPLPQSYPGVEEWQSTRYVLAKLMRYPNLDTGNVMAFRNAYNQSSAALFARFDSMMNMVLLASTGSQTNLNNLEASIRSKQAQIIALDGTITDVYNIPSGLLSSRATLLNELAILSNQRDYILTQNTNAIAPLLLSCEQFNNGLPASQGYEQNQKVLNAFAIQLARGTELSQTDKDALHAIAQQCYEIAGRTKSSAASMLPPEEGAPYWKENPEEYNCPQRNERNREDLSVQFMLSPNPVSDVLSIKFEMPFKGEIAISDLSGRILQQFSTLEGAMHLDIPITQLANGVYVLAFSGIDEKSPMNTKFIVLR